MVGYALPVKRTDRGWVSGSWFLRDSDTLWLLPGDSPMGLRLPLDSIPWVAEKDYPWNWPQDPTQKLPPLPREFSFPVPAPAEASGQRFLRTGIPPTRAGSGPGERAQVLDAGHGRESSRTLPDDPDRRPDLQQSAPWIIRTALCVEPRNGRLHVFLPPVSTTEDYLELIAALEATVQGLGMPIVIEGEAPPRDPRLQRMAVTPDPGVIEVNLPPSASWG